MSEKPESGRETIPDEDWKFGFFLDRLTPAEWPVLINYEYGRSYRPLVEDVLKFREPPRARAVGTQPDPRSGLEAAKFWAKYYPEFPWIPYERISNQERARRLKHLSLESAADSNFEVAVRSHNPDVFFSQIAFGDLSLDAALRQRLLILEIDPTRSPKVLRQQLQERLDERLASLREQGVPVGKQARGNVGRRANPRVVEVCMKNLAALRLVADFSWDWQKASDHAAARDLRLYTREQSAWERAYRNALYLMRRFELSWQRHYWPEFVLDPKRFEGPSAVSLGKPFPSQDKAAAEAAAFESELRPRILTFHRRQELAGKVDPAK